MSYSIFEWNFGNLLLNGTILQFVKRRKKPGFHYNLHLSYSQKKKKKNVIFFQQATSDYTVTIAHAKKKKNLIRYKLRRKENV